MIKVAILGDIGSGKTFVSNKFGYPVFNADKEVANIYKKNIKNCSSISSFRDEKVFKKKCEKENGYSGHPFVH